MTTDKSWSSSPVGVTMKLTIVVSAWISGGKCGFESFVCRKSRKSGCCSTSSSPSRIMLRSDLLMKVLETTGRMTGSIFSAMFSIITENPRPIASWSLRSMSFCPRRRICRFRDDSFCLSQVIPCKSQNCKEAFYLHRVCLATFNTQAFMTSAMVTVTTSDAVCSLVGSPCATFMEP